MAQLTVHSWWRSLAARGVALAVLFVALPLVLYQLFQHADQQRQQLLISSAQTTALTIGRAMEYRLARTDTAPSFRVGEELAPFQRDGLALRLLFRPAAPADGGFLLVAAAPPVAADEAEAVRAQLAAVGALDRLGESCAGDRPLALRRDRRDGTTELVTAIVPIQSTRGCWALVVANDLGSLTDQVGNPYWQRREVQIAALLYLAFALLVAAIALDVRHTLRRFADTARAVASHRDRSRFTDVNPLPELKPVAEAFDGMVDRLRDGALQLRDAAEETAHAFKTPLGTIRQAIEPLRRRVDAGDARGVIALAAVEESLDRLDGLLQQARRLDDSAAALLDPSADPVDIKAVIEASAEHIETYAEARGVMVAVNAVDGVTLPRGGNLLEAALDQVLDNALAFSPADGMIKVVLSTEGGMAKIVVEDDGPGVQMARLPKLFERGVSERPPEATPGFGLGLWIVRRNLAALDGTVTAENRPEGGFRVTFLAPIDSRARPR